MKINFEHHCFFFLLILLSCNGDSKTVNTSRNENHTNHHFKVNKIHLIADTVLQLGEEIDCMFQEDNNTFWFGCNGDGLYKYDGKHLLHYTNKHGLVSNFVWSIQQDKIGNIWISTRDGICNFDGIENQANQTVYFYCRSPKILPFIKFTNHHVLISGFVSGRNVGAGTLTLSGIDAAKMLSTYFFAVKNDPEHHDDKYVYIVATGEIRCEMGTGGRPLQFPGLLG